MLLVGPFRDQDKTNLLDRCLRDQLKTKNPYNQIYDQNSAFLPGTPMYDQSHNHCSRPFRHKPLDMGGFASS